MDPLIRELEISELKRRRQKLLLAKKIAAFIISGTIVPSSLTIFQVLKNFSESYKNHEKSFDYSIEEIWKDIDINSTIIVSSFAAIVGGFFTGNYIDEKERIYNQNKVKNKINSNCYLVDENEFEVEQPDFSILADENIIFSGIEEYHEDVDQVNNVKRHEYNCCMK